MRQIGKTFLTGFATVVPIALTIYLIYWLSVTSESALGALFRYLLPDGLYRPGMGLAAGIVLVFLVGMLMHAWVVRRLFALGEHLLYRIPLIRSVYGSIRDLINLFSRDQKDALHQTVIIHIGGMRLIGFVTRSDLSSFPDEIGGPEDIAVYLPMSYMIGGYLIIVPRSDVQPIDMSVEDALRFILTAGIAGAKGMPRD